MEQSVQQQQETELQQVCPVCHVGVRQTDFYCFNCGKALREKLEPISWSRQLAVYVGSLVLPPMGIIWGMRYMRRGDRQAKMVGLVAVVLTLVVMILGTIAMIQVMNEVNRQVELKVNNLMGY